MPARPLASSSCCSARLSISIDSICSTYSGLPSAAATMRSTTSLRQTGLAEQVGDHLLRRPASLSGCSTQRRRRSAARASRAALEQVVPRGGQQQDRRRRSAASSTCSSRSRKAGSAQWMSSISAMTGAVAGQAPPGTCRAAQYDLVQRVAGLRSGRSPRPGGRPRRRRRSRPSSLRARLLGRVVVADVGRRAHHLDQRPEGDAVAVGQAAAAQHACA